MEVAVRFSHIIRGAEEISRELRPHAPHLDLPFGRVHPYTGTTPPVLVHVGVLVCADPILVPYDTGQPPPVQVQGGVLVHGVGRTGIGGVYQYSPPCTSIGDAVPVIGGGCTRTALYQYTPPL